MPRSPSAARFSLSGYGHCCGLMAIGAARVRLAHVSLHPFVQDIETPGARPRGAAREIILPNSPREITSQMRLESRRPLRQSRGDALTERSTEPVLPGKSEGAFLLRDDFFRQEIAEGLYQKRFGTRRVALRAVWER